MSIKTKLHNKNAKFEVNKFEVNNNKKNDMKSHTSHIVVSKLGTLLYILKQ